MTKNLLTWYRIILADEIAPLLAACNLEKGGTVTDQKRRFIHYIGANSSWFCERERERELHGLSCCLLPELFPSCIIDLCLGALQLSLWQFALFLRIDKCLSSVLKQHIQWEPIIAAVWSICRFPTIVFSAYLQYRNYRSLILNSSNSFYPNYSSFLYSHFIYSFHHLSYQSTLSMT